MWYSRRKAQLSCSLRRQNEYNCILAPYRSAHARHKLKLMLHFMRKLSMEELNRLTVTDFKNTRKFPLTLVLDNVRSLHNVGAAFRTADAFAIEKIWPGSTPLPPWRRCSS